MSAAVDTIVDGDTVVALIVRAEVSPQETTFVTDDDASLQVGFVVYPSGGRVQPHRHLPLERTVSTTAEVILVRSGRCFVDLYRDDDSVLATRALAPGDVIALLGGAHGFRMEEDTVLLEVKQGPYLGPQEKERFDP